MVNVGEDPWLRLNMTFGKVIHVRPFYIVFEALRSVSFILYPFT